MSRRRRASGRRDVIDGTRFEIALTVAGQILAMAGLPATPERLSRITYTILDAIYEAERRLAGQPEPQD